MKPRITILTLTVNDLQRSLEFYRDGLGFETEGIIGTESEYGAVVFIDLEGGLKLGLWPRNSLSHDCGLPDRTTDPISHSLGHNVTSESEVDRVMQEAKTAGARIIKPAQKTFWGGYAGYFMDPDQHLWEVVYNPHLLPESSS